MNTELVIAADREALLDEVVTRYLKASEAGAQPDPDEWLVHHPELRDELIAFFADQKRVEQIAAPLRALSPPNNAETVAYAGGDSKGDTQTASEHALEDYELLEEVGRGGMGVVYKARQRSLNRVVALKMILAGPFASRADVARFRSEAEAAASLDHPNIVPVYGSGEAAGQPYFTMKFVEGTNLARNPPTTPRAIAELLVPVARAVHYAHQRGILHRDLKPSNILLSADGRPHVTDFGLARRIESALTVSGRVAGTPIYMAPEQAVGARHLTTAVDVYGLGAVLYEGLTGQPPFQGETMLAILDQVRDREPQKPRSIRWSIPRDLETICLKCLHKDPMRRYPSADALADDLERFLAGEPVRARRTGPIERATKWARRRPALAALSVAVVALAGLVIGLLSTRLERAEAGLGEAADREEKLKATVDERDRTAKLVEATLCFEKGSTRLQQSDTAAGLLWLVRALELAPEDATELRAGIRRQLGAGAQQIHPVRAVLTHGSDETIHHVAISLDGKCLLTTATLTLWLHDAATRKVIGAPHQYREEIKFTAFRPDSKEVLVGTTRHLHRIEVGTGKPIGEPIEVFPANSDDVLLAGGFAPDGRRFYALGLDRKFHVFGTEAGAKVLICPVPSAFPEPPVFSPDGKRLLVVGQREVTIRKTDDWGLAAEQLALALEAQESITCALWTSDGKAVLLAIDTDTKGSKVEVSSRVEFWVPGLKRGPLGKPLEIGKTRNILLTHAADGQHILAMANDGKWRLWDEEKGQLLREGSLGPNLIQFFQLSPDGRKLLTTRAGGEFRLENADTLDQPGSPTPGRGRSATFGPDGRSLLIGCSDGTARLHDIRSTSKTVRQLAARGPRIVGFTDDGKSAFVVAEKSQTLGDNERVMGPLFDELHKLSGNFLPHGLSPGNRFLLVSMFNRESRTTVYRVYDVRSGKIIGDIRTTDLPNPFYPFSLSSDGRTLVAAIPSLPLPDTKPGTEIRRWDVVTGKPIGEPVRTDGNIHALGFTPDHKSVLVAGSPNANSRISLWRYDVESGKRVGSPVEIATKGDSVIAAFAPDGKSVLVNSYYGLRVWDVETGKPRGEALMPPGGTKYVFYGPDGRTLAAVTDPKGEVHLWDAATLKPLGPKIPTDVFKYSGSQLLFAFSPDGKQFAALVDGKLTVFEVPQPLEGDVEHIRLWVEVNTGKELDAGGALLDIGREEWLKRWERLQKFGDLPLKK